MTTLNVTPLNDDRPPLMVVSHERSGTHFMMNALAACFNYVSYPWVDIDRHAFNINYYHAPSLHILIEKLVDRRFANVIKCHHEFAFFSEFVAALKGKVEIVYIYRHPADVMASYWRFLHSFNWTEGPRADSALDFATRAPMGQLLRLQLRQYDTMLDRWANHVRHWTEAHAPNAHVHLVKYEELADRYEATIAGLGTALGLRPTGLERPARDKHVVNGGPIPYAPPAEADNRAAVAALALSKFPDLMARLGYAAG